MAKKINYGKWTAVVFLTILIWIFADRAIETTYSVPNATLQVARSLPPDVYVTVGEDAAEVAIKKILLKGPASKVAEFERKLKSGSISVDFFFDPTEEKAMISPDKLDLLAFLKNNPLFRQMSLSVVSCEPETVNADVVRLTKKALEVVCVDEGGNVVKTEMVDPPKVEMFVPEDWGGEKLRAYVELSRAEIEQARVNPVAKKPYIRFVGGQVRGAEEPVRITIATESDRLSDQTVTTATLGVIMSPVLQEKYRVEIVNLPQVLSAISIRSTDEAKQAYESEPYQVLLEVKDADREQKNGEPLRRKLIYNFPAEYVRGNQIELKQQPVTAQFRLIPLGGAKAP